MRRVPLDLRGSGRDEPPTVLARGDRRNVPLSFAASPIDPLLTPDVALNRNPRVLFRALASTLLWELRHRVWHLGAWQRWYGFAVERWRPMLHASVVSPGIDVVIEGYPRSANTFLVTAVMQAVDPAPRIAHHVHEPMQIRLAERLGIPCFLLLRNPLDAATSWKLKAPYMSSALLLKIYISFYSYSRRYAHAVQFLQYEDVISDPDKVVDTIVSAVGRLQHASVEAVNTESVFAGIDLKKREREARQHSGSAVERYELTVAYPTEQKELQKEEIMTDLRRNQARLLSKASELYRELLGKCVRVSPRTAP
jgi:hypothetical protein